MRSLLRFPGGMVFGVNMYAFTPFTTMGSDLTPNRSRRGWRFAAVRLIVAANAFHSSEVFGGVFQLSGIGVERSCCISGLTVSGVGSIRAGICRGAGVVWTLP